MCSLSAFNFVLNKAREIYGLKVIVEHLDTKYASHCIPALKCLIINSNCNQDDLPMIAGHELGHYVNGDEPRSSIATFSYTANEEAEADKFGIGLLYEYAENEDLVFDTSQDFSQAFSIPKNRQLQVDELAKNHRNVFYTF